MFSICSNFVQMSTAQEGGTGGAVQAPAGRVKKALPGRGRASLGHGTTASTDGAFRWMAAAMRKAGSDDELCPLSAVQERFAAVVRI